MDQIVFERFGNKIQGYFFESREIPALATVLFLQGFPGIEGDELMCESLAQRDIHVMTFNYRGTFQSEGTFSFSNAIDDIHAAIQYLTDRDVQEQYSIDEEKLILGGWSFGSGLVPAGAIRNREITRLFCISGRDFGVEARRIEQNPDYMREVFQNLLPLRKPKGPVHFKDDLLADLCNNQETLDIANITPKLRDYDVLLIGGWDDPISPIEHHLIPFYRSLVENGNNQVRIEALDTDHEFSNCRNELVELIYDWIQSTILD